MPCKERRPRFTLPRLRCRGMAPARQSGMARLTLSSPAFVNEGSIPARFTGEGDDLSPPLRWSGAPAGTKSFALILDDPDAPDPAAPKRVWVHWVLANIPASVSELVEGASSAKLPPDTVVGKNDWGRAAYGGPCPPIGRHRYFHKLYALDTVLDLPHPTKAQLEHAMKGHVLAEGVLIGTYQKSS